MMHPNVFWNVHLGTMSSGPEEGGDRHYDVLTNLCGYHLELCVAITFLSILLFFLSIKLHQFLVCILILMLFG